MREYGRTMKIQGEAGKLLASTTLSGLGRGHALGNLVLCNPLGRLVLLNLGLNQCTGHSGIIIIIILNTGPFSRVRRTSRRLRGLLEERNCLGFFNQALGTTGTREICDGSEGEVGNTVKDLDECAVGGYESSDGQIRGIDSASGGREVEDTVETDNGASLRM